MREAEFKKTIPQGWDLKPLSEILSLYGRIGFRGYNVSDLVGEKKGAISLSPSNIENGIVTFNKCAYLSWAKYEESPEIQVQEGDILLVKTGSTYGKVGYVETLPWPATINPQYVVLKNFKCNSRVLSYLLEQNDFQNQIEAITSGGAIPTMSQAKILTCTITLPPVAEQQRIADALSDVDSLIATLKKLIEKKRAIKEGAMQELLSGKKRLPGFNEGWDLATIGEAFDFLPNNTFSRDKLSNSGIVQNVHYGDVLIKFGPILDAQKEDIPYIADCQYKYANHVKDGDVIIADTAEDETVGKATEIINVGDKKIVSGLHTMWLRPKNEENYARGYLGYAFNVGIYHDQLLPLMQGTKVTSISKNSIQGTYILVPPKQEQRAITTILSDMDSEIHALEKRLAKYQSLKQGMMQQLLTGKIRLV